jgi:hypothetical protein
MTEFELAKEKKDLHSSSHIMTGDYVTLMETSGKECESWYYFIRKEGNEEALQNLHEQLEKVNWYILDDFSTFDLDMEHFVSAQTAKQMTKLELNSYMFHRKFDGKLSKIDFGFNDKDKNKKKIKKAFELLGYGQIDEYISDEDIDPEDLLSCSESGSDSSDSYEESSDFEEESSDSEEDKKTVPIQKPIEKKNKTPKGLPPSLVK